MIVEGDVHWCGLILHKNTKLKQSEWASSYYLGGSMQLGKGLSLALREGTVGDSRILW